MQSDQAGPAPDDGDAVEEPADRDERRIRALERLFRRAHEGERRLSRKAMTMIGDALRGDPPED